MESRPNASGKGAAPLRFVATKAAKHTLRIAFCGSHSHPLESQRWAHQDATRLTAALRAESVWFHSSVPDPACLPRDLRVQLGRSLLLPTWKNIHEQAQHHFRFTLPERYAALATRAQLEPTADLTEPPLELQQGFSAARWLRAWRADAVVAFHPHAPAVGAALASFLLDIPLLLSLDGYDLGNRLDPMCEALVRQARLTLVQSAANRERLLHRLGAEFESRISVCTDRGLGEPTVVERLRHAIETRPKSAPELGPAAAFRTERAEPWPKDAARLFVIVCAERTGSNMLVSLLNRHPEITCAGEVFNPRMMSDGRLAWCGGRTVTDRLDLLQLRASDSRALLHALAREAKALGKRWVGFKLMYNHALVDDRIVDTLLADPTIPIVHLRRRDRLARYVSFERALQTDLWGTVPHGPNDPPQPPLQLDAAAIVRDFGTMERSEAWADAAFEAHPLVQLDYDRLAADPGAEVRRIGAALQVELDAPAGAGKRSRSDLAGKIANAEALQAAFRGTRWQEYFDFFTNADNVGSSSA